MVKQVETSSSEKPGQVAQFEQSLDELEQLVAKMEQGDLGLDDSLKSFERGISLYRECQTALEQAELRVKLLTDPADPASARDYPTQLP
ncbi:MAG: exodeoxyribonuclease VII small subunit [Dokdonella sp.]